MVFSVLMRGLAVKFLKGAVEMARVLVAHGANDLFDGKTAGAQELFRCLQAVLLQQKSEGFSKDLADAPGKIGFRIAER